MNVLKTSLFISLFLSGFLAGYGQKNTVFYRDTSVKEAGITISAYKTYARAIFFKVNLFVNNPTDNYLVIDTRDIVLYRNEKDSVPESSVQIIIVPPNNSKKFRIKYFGKDLKKSRLDLHFNKIAFTYPKGETISIENMEVKDGAEVKKGPLELSIIKVDPNVPKYRVETQLKYTGSNMLHINYGKIYMNINGVHKYSNAKIRDQFFYNKLEKHENIWLVFFTESPISKKKDAPELSFPDAFVEHELKIVPGFKMVFIQGGPGF